MKQKLLTEARTFKNNDTNQSLGQDKMNKDEVVTLGDQ